MDVTDPAEREALEHPALFYRSDEQYLAGLVPFITDGLAGREPVAVAVPGRNLRLLQGALGRAAGQVRMLDMTEAGRNPGRIIPGVLRSFADAHPDRHVRIIGEPIWPGRTDTEYPACVQHEALINNAFTGRDVTIVCPYDTAGLDARALADAHATHPVLWEGDGSQRSSRYAPAEVIDRYNQPLACDGTVAFPVTRLIELSAARRFAVDHGARLGLAPTQIENLQLIVTELATNSLRHTAGTCELRIWRDGEHLVCDVRDTGQLTDPLAGRRPPAAGQLSGRGLLMVNQLADLVRVHTSAQGTTIQARLTVPG